MPVPNRPDGPTLLDDLRARFAELISTLIFVFAGEGAGMAFNKLTSDASTTPAGLISASIALAFALLVVVSVGSRISVGHVNPSVTFRAFIEATSPYFESTPTFALSAGVGVWNAVVFEIVKTFGLVYTVYATAVDPKKGDVGVIVPIAIGFVVGANILAMGHP